MIMKDLKIIPSIFFIVFFIFLAQCSWAEEFDNATNTTLPDDEMPGWVTPYYSPYEAKNKTDPFVSFVKVRAYELLEAAKRAKAQKKASTPLETVEVHTLKLIGIINKGNGQTAAMVELPDGKGYLIRPGTIVGLYDGVVKEIKNATVVVEENIMDIFGESKQRTINLRLRQEKE